MGDNHKRFRRTVGDRTDDEREVLSLSKGLFVSFSREREEFFFIDIENGSRQKEKIRGKKREG